MKILFQGDSITAGGRGTAVGYPIYAVKKLNELFPNNNFEFENKAIWGNTINDLYNRLEKDVYNVNPDIICLLIGVNNVLKLEVGTPIDTTNFERDFEKLLKEIKNKTNAYLLYLEPYLFEDEPLRRNKYVYFKEYIVKT